MRLRSWRRGLLAAAFVFLAVNAGLEALNAQVPSSLRLLQSAVALTAATAAWGTWSLTRWAAAASLAYGIVTSIMLVFLPGLLDLDTESRNGIWMGAAAVLVLGIAGAWYLNRSYARARAVHSPR